MQILQINLDYVKLSKTKCYCYRTLKRISNLPLLMRVLGWSKARGGGSINYNSKARGVGLISYPVAPFACGPGWVAGPQAGWVVSMAAALTL